jgi:polar amino acid transport system permease protein
VATAPAEKPVRDFGWLREQSEPVSLAALVLGALGLLAATVGVVVVVAMHGFTPYEDVVRAFLSAEMTGVGVWAVGLGLAASAIGIATFRRMPTKVSREGAIAGAVLGVQAALLGALLLWFGEGDVGIFVQNFLNFEAPSKQIDAFFTGATNTLLLALTSELFGILLGLLLAIFTISKRAVVRAPARVYINFFRGTPLLWQISVIGIGLPLGLGIDIDTYTAGILALSLNMGAYSAEVFRAGIQSIERGQLEAARGLGMSYGQAMRYSIVPQAVRRVIPPLMNEFVILVKDTSLVVFLGLAAGERDLLSVASQGFGNSFNSTFFIFAAIGYLAICLPAMWLVNRVERRLRSGLVGVTA